MEKEVEKERKALYKKYFVIGELLPDIVCTPALNL